MVESQQRFPNLIFLSAGAIDFSNSWVCWMARNHGTYTEWIVSICGCLKKVSDMLTKNLDRVRNLLTQFYKLWQRSADTNVCLTTEARTLDKAMGAFIAPPF
jgi:hypothetical protein